MCKVNASTIRAAQTRGRMKNQNPSHQGSGPSRRAADCPLFTTFLRFGSFKKTLGNVIQTKLQFFSDNEKAPLLRDQSLVALSVSTQTL